MKTRTKNIMITLGAAVALLPWTGFLPSTKDIVFTLLGLAALAAVYFDGSNQVRTERKPSKRAADTFTESLSAVKSADPKDIIQAN